MAILTAIPTVRGAHRIGRIIARDEAPPIGFKWYLATGFSVGSIGTPQTFRQVVTFSQVTAVTAAADLARNSTDIPISDWFDGVAQSGSFLGSYLQTKQLSHVASGNLDWRFWVQTNDDATEANREVWWIADAGEDQLIPDGQTGNIDIEYRFVVP